MATKKKAAASLHVLLAPGAPLGVVLRSGPGETAGAFLWDRKKDAFTAGAGLRGRVYGRRSDLSPDGKYLLYFAASRTAAAETGGSWTAVSRAPWFKPLVLLGKGDLWHGGGLFTGKRSYWVNEGFGHRAIRNSPEVVRDMSYVPMEYYGGEDTGVYYLRLQRDGWELKRYAAVGEWHGCTIFEKPLPRGWVLRKLAHEEAGRPPAKGRYWEEHELESPGRRVGCPEWEWADADGPSVVWAERGCLYRARISGPAGLGGVEKLKDFNGAKPSAGKPPY